MSDKTTTRCVDCGSEFTDAELRGVDCSDGMPHCPMCKTTSLPCRIDDDVTVRINWHELRILGIWASNWAMSKCDADAQRMLKHLLGRLEAQRPRPDLAPLSIAGELAQLVDEGTVEEATIRIGDRTVQINKKD